MSQVSDAAPKRGQMSNARKMWEDRLNADVVGAQESAESFTKQFVNVMYSGTSSVQQNSQQQQQQQQQQQFSQEQTDHVAAPPPALPPKTKIMFSPSRHVFSPTTESEESSMNTMSSVASTVKESKEFIPVKEKAKMIALQQQEIIRREESKTQEGGGAGSGRMAGENLKGGVRLLPPSPQTVRKEYNDSPQTVRTFDSMETASSSSSFQYQSFQQQSSSSSTAVQMMSSGNEGGVTVQQQQQSSSSANQVSRDREVSFESHDGLLKVSEKQQSPTHVNTIECCFSFLFRFPATFLFWKTNTASVKILSNSAKLPTATQLRNFNPPLFMFSPALYQRRRFLPPKNNKNSNNRNSPFWLLLLNKP